MGSTAVALAVDEDRAVLAHVGDSRIYRLRDGVLEQLTRDHSLLEELRRMGAVEHPEGIGHVITQAIGFGEDTRPDVRVELARPGDALLLCSDGLTDPLDEESLARLLADPDPARACDRLVEAAYEAGGTDNITALVVRVT
jgi:serine/threonine protein phosphatase PrpC